MLNLIIRKLIIFDQTMFKALRFPTNISLVSSVTDLEVIKYKIGRTLCFFGFLFEKNIKKKIKRCKNPSVYKIVR